MKKIFKNNIFIIFITFIIPSSIAFLTRDSFHIYKELLLPKYAPPSYLFPVAWSILYLLMSIAYIFVKENNKCSIIYYFQLALNALWTPIFFMFNNYLFAFVELIVLLLSVIYMTYLFYIENNKTIFLLMPYILWLLFASYLNYFVYLYN